MLREIGDGNIADLSGQDVVVVGGGNVAIDASLEAHAASAHKSVKIVYRRRRADMTALAEEIDRSHRGWLRAYGACCPCTC